MSKKLICAAALFALGACSEINYTDNRLAAKYTYNGTTYDVYQAIEVDQSGAFAAGTAIETKRSVYRLFPEGADPQTEGSTTGLPLGTDREIATCAATLAQCKIEFGKVLGKRKAATKSNPEDEEDRPH